MDENMVVLVLDPEDPQLSDIRRISEPMFGIVQEMGGWTKGMYQERPCKVQLDGGRIEIFPLERLVPLLELPEEDAVMFSPTEAFSKWATEIVKRQALMHLPEGQRDFLSRLALNAT